MAWRLLLPLPRQEAICLKNGRSLLAGDRVCKKVHKDVCKNHIASEQATVGSPAGGCQSDQADSSSNSLLIRRT